MHHKTVESLKNKMEKLDQQLTKIEKEINTYMVKLEKEGYENIQIKSENWIEKDGIAQTEEIVLKEENFNLLLAVRQCIYWEHDYKRYQEILKKLDEFLEIF